LRYRKRGQARGSAGSIDTKNRLRRIYAGRRTPSRLWGAVEAVGECDGARPFNSYGDSGRCFDRDILQYLWRAM
jgi:hypothetical protein